MGEISDNLAVIAAMTNHTMRDGWEERRRGESKSRVVEKEDPFLLLFAH